MPSQDNSDLQALLTLALSTERETAERLRSLHEMRGFLHEESLIGLLSKAVTEEKTIEVRRAILELLCLVDFTRLQDKMPLIEALAQIAALDAEANLRVMALRRLTDLPHEGGFSCEALFAESLVCDLDESVQSVCLYGLSRCIQKSPETIQKLVEYGRRASRELRQSLIEIFSQLPAHAAQIGYAIFLSPWEEPAVKRRALALLAQFPALAPATLSVISQFLGQEQDSTIKAETLKVIFSSKEADPKALLPILDWVESAYNPRELLSLFKDWLAAAPELVESLATLFKKSSSAVVRLAVLSSLEDAQLADLFASALKDANPWVRVKAIDWCRRHLEQHAEKLYPAIADAIAAEPLVGIRLELARAMNPEMKKAPKVEQALLRHFTVETEPAIQERLGRLLCSVALTDENRGAVLSGFQKLMLNPMVDAELKSKIAERLRSFAYRDEPALFECLKTLLERESEVEKAEAYVEQLRKLEPDLHKWEGALLRVFYRFIDHYPRAALHEWLQDFKKLATTSDAVRSQIPYIVKLTGASWLLEGANANEKKTAFLPTMIEALRRGAYRGPENLLDDAWNSRTLRKSDLLSLFNCLLCWPQKEGVLQHVFTIMAQANLVTADIIDRCMQVISSRTLIECSYEIEKYLTQVASKDSSYRERVMTALSQEAYDHYILTSGEIPRAMSAPPRSWNEWDYQGWGVAYPEWPVARLFFALDNPKPEFAKVLETPVAQGIPANHTIHYLMLHKLWQSPTKSEADLRALGKLMRSTKGAKSLEPLHDRAVCVFWKLWKSADSQMKASPIAPDLAEMAAEAYVELRRRQDAFMGMAAASKSKPRAPDPLLGMNQEYLTKIWPFSVPI